MSSPIVRHSVQDQTTTGAGSDVAALGHYHTGLFVATDTSPTSLTVQLEVSPDETHWAVAEDLSGGSVEITEADLATDPDSGEEVAHVKTAGLYAQALRARVSTYDAAGNVNAYVLMGGNAGQGRRGTQRKGPVGDI